MPRTPDQILQELLRRKYPCGVLDSDDFTGILQAAVREFNAASPLVAFAFFTSVGNQQDYYIFDPADTTTQIEDPDNVGQFLALCAGAISVRDVYWNPGGDWSSLNLFSPGWQMLSQMIVFTGSYFHQPSSLTVLRQKLDHWKTQFGSQGFEVIGEPGTAGAYLRIYPVPLESGSRVLVEYTKAHTVSDIDASYERHLMQWVEVYAAEALANYYAGTSGVELLGFKTSDDALKYWSGRADALRKRAEGIQLGPQGHVARSY